MMRSREESGFTLVELLVTMTLAFVIFGATLGVLQVFQKDTSAAQTRNETQDSARSAMDRLSRELRSVAAPGAAEPGALEQAAPNSLTFQTIDFSRTSAGSNATDAMRVRYCLDDSNPTNEILWRQVKRWETEKAPAIPASTACPDRSGSDWDSSAQLVQHLTNRIGGSESRPLFVYGPPAVASTAKITSVEPNLYIDLNPGGRPGESQLSTGIALRNENRQPTALFTAVQLGAERRVLLNASESQDPDGLALTYKWWDGATLLPTTAQQYETGPLTVGSTHVFKLEVADPGSLTGTYELTVVIK
jgi:type II secretory pathway pseudopilin PulG